MEFWRDRAWRETAGAAQSDFICDLTEVPLTTIVLMVAYHGAQTTAISCVKFAFLYRPLPPFPPPPVDRPPH